jgi:hypothetical protein
METPLDFGDQATLDASLSTQVRGLQESGILRITRQVRGMIARGETVVNLTVGDFDPRYFPIPRRLSEAIQAAVARGETNYPNPEGLPALRQAISDYVARTAGVRYPLDAIVVCSGGRPVLFGAYHAVVNPGDKVLFSVPSWQNDAYSWLTGAESIVIDASHATGFQPTVDQFRPHLGEAAMVCIHPIKRRTQQFLYFILRVQLRLVPDGMSDGFNKRFLIVIVRVFGGQSNPHTAKQRFQRSHRPDADAVRQSGSFQTVIEDLLLCFRREHDWAVSCRGADYLVNMNAPRPYVKTTVRFIDGLN